MLKRDQLIQLNAAYTGKLHAKFGVRQAIRSEVDLCRWMYQAT